MNSAPFDTLRLGVLATLRFDGTGLNAKTQRRKDARRIQDLGAGAGSHAWCVARGRSFLRLNYDVAEQIAAANAGQRLGFAGKLRIGLSPRAGVAELGR